MEDENEFIVLRWFPQPLDLDPIDHFWDVVEQEDNYFKINNAINEFCLKGFVINETCSSNGIPFDMYRKR